MESHLQDGERWQTDHAKRQWTAPSSGGTQDGYPEQICGISIAYRNARSWPLAISLEEEDERVYADFAEGLRQNFPASAAIFDGMRTEESTHRRRLLDLFREKFGDHIPLLRRQDVRGFVRRKPVWLVRPLGLDTVRGQASAMEVETRNFYERAAARAQDVHIRQLLDDLAQEERSHEDRAEALEKDKLRPDVKHREDEANRRLFVLQIVQPGLAGLMDGSVSTLAPVFAAALATHNSWDAFVVGLAASIGAGISMGFAEALSDDGSLTGRESNPWVRGLICGLPSTAVGGIGHTFTFPHSRFPVSHDCRGLCGRDRARRYFLGPSPLHGDTGALGRAAGWIGRRPSVRYRHPDRQLLARPRAASRGSVGACGSTKPRQFGLGSARVSAY